MKQKTRFSFENDVIKCNYPKDSIIVKVNQNNTEEPSALFCTKIIYIHGREKDIKGGETFDHHLMIYNGNKPIFKVWLPNENEDKEFDGVEEALKSVGMEVHQE